MALTSSRMLALGTVLPDFSLRDVRTNQLVTNFTLPAAPGYLVMVICNHCPYVVHVRKAITAFAKRAQAHGFEVLAVSANDAVAYPEDGPEAMATLAENEGFTFPYLYDQQQEFVKKLQAVCTPEFYFFDASRKLVYRGQMDDSRPRNHEANDAHNLETVLQAVLKGEKISGEQKPSVGCSIKWLST